MINCKRIRQIRRLRDMTQAELAMKMGYASSNSVHKLERGCCDLPFTRMEKMAAILGIPLNELIIADLEQTNNEEE